ncbi:helix-turn-helix transcriptional regulator [Anaerostipes caccae]|uniref:helix-turn-helix domain-containing protein n=1 Tax=Anaerostipes caccae TaxID=105841 RepID=UPI002ED44B3F
MMVKKLLGDTVKEERLRRKLSQITLAEKAQVSLRTISDIETYRANPQLDTLVPLIKYLNISLDAIIFSEESPPDHTMRQIMGELDQCSGEEKLVALSILRGYLSAIHKQ